MNNDFNFRPRQNPNSTNNQPQNDESSDEEVNSSAGRQVNDNQAIENKPAVTTMSNKSGAGKKFLKFLGLLILLALVAGGVWYWQQLEVKNLHTTNDSLEKQVSDLRAEAVKDKSDNETAAPATETPVSTYNVITGSVTNSTETGADVTVQYLPGTATEVWVEYGLKPDDLKSTTAKTKATSAGTPGTYVEQAVALTKLQSGAQYFYRAAATVDGKTVYGGVVAFKATK